MKLLRSLVFILIMSKAVIFSSSLASEFSEQDIENQKSNVTFFSCCFSDKFSDHLGYVKDVLFMLYRPCQGLNQLFIFFPMNEGAEYSCRDVPHLISHVLSLIAGKEKVKFPISRKATQDLAQYWDEEVEEKPAPPLSIAIPPLSIAIPPVSDGRPRGSSNDWYIGRSPTSPNRGWASPVLVN